MDDPPERGDHPLSDGHPSDTPDTSRDHPRAHKASFAPLTHRVTLEIALSNTPALRCSLKKSREIKWLLFNWFVYSESPTLLFCSIIISRIMRTNTMTLLIVFVIIVICTFNNAEK